MCIGRTTHIMVSAFKSFVQCGLLQTSYQKVRQQIHRLNMTQFVIQ